MSARLFWPELEPAELADGWLPDPPQLTAGQVLDALSRRHPMDGWGGRPGRWVFVRETCARSGSGGAEQRFDAVAIGLVPASGAMAKSADVVYGSWPRVVYEVKVSRADWLRELQRVPASWNLGEHQKWDAALAVSTQFWYAAPPRCILPDELPPEAGLLEVRLWGPRQEARAKVLQPAPVRQTPNPGPEFWAAVLRESCRLPVFTQLVEPGP